jgi:peptide/nickel transport system ATP-binding protein
VTSALIEAKHVSKSFIDERDLLGRPRRTIRALHDVSLTLRAGQSLGLVGESGCGKSTLARLLIGLDMPNSGSLSLSGAPYPAHHGQRQRRVAQHVQMVFQDPMASLNPRKTGLSVLTAPLRALTELDSDQRLRRARQVLELVELPERVLQQYPHELSGGQAQRLAIARALAPRPQLLILDEAVSSLDVSIQARVLQLLHRLRSELELSYVFIGHDLAVIEVLCEEIAVMYLGSIVEQGPTRTILDNARHPYTRVLRSAVPVIGQRPRRIELSGPAPSPAHPPQGCSFHTRCYRAEERCSQQVPSLSAGLADHPCACFFAHDSEPPEPAHSDDAPPSDVGAERAPKSPPD